MIIIHFPYIWYKKPYSLYSQCETDLGAKSAGAKYPSHKKKSEDFRTSPQYIDSERKVISKDVRDNQQIPKRIHCTTVFDHVYFSVF